MIRCCLMVLMLVCQWTRLLNAEIPNVQVSGQLAGWSGVRWDQTFLFHSGIRLVPALSGSYHLNEQHRFDFEASTNVQARLVWEEGSLVDTMATIQPYRIWLRYTTNRFELRAGLQKINFGPAKMFRPLQWFDAKDIRDPLQLTSGVYGVMAKYFLNRTSAFWLWSLFGNKQPKGYELMGSASGMPEWGGHVEFPFLHGEVGLAYHHRTLSQQNNLMGRVLGDVRHQENRFGIHGRWDWKVGVWFETSVSLINENAISEFQFPKVTDMFNLGMDYTLPVGDGLGLTLEYFRYHTGSTFLRGGMQANVLGLMLHYPLTINDQLTAMLFHMPSSNQSATMSFVSWSRSWNRFTLYAMAFLQPRSLAFVALPMQNRNVFAGRGIQLLGTFHF